MIRAASVKLGLRDRGDQWNHDLYNETIDVLDERGIEHGHGKHEYEPVLPVSASPRFAAGESKRDIEKLVQRDLVKAFSSGGNFLKTPLMTAGKSTGAIKATSITGEDIMFAMPRGRNEGYDDTEELCESEGLTSQRLPSSRDQCDLFDDGSFNDEYSERIEDQVSEALSCGLSLKECHALINLPCGPDCLSWSDVDEDADVNIGHYKHLNAPKAFDGRILVIDEFSPEFVSTFNDAESITKYLQRHDELQFESYTDLMAGRNDLDRAIPSEAWLRSQPMRDPELAPDGIHARAPTMVYVILASAIEPVHRRRTKLFEQTTLPNGNPGLLNTENGEVSILSPPNLSSARGVVALDGTGNQKMWETMLGIDLEHDPVLDDEEWREYLTETMNYRFVVTTDWVKPYNSVSNVNVSEDTALVKEIHEKFGKPLVFTTQKAETEKYHASNEFMKHVKDIVHYGDLKSSNLYSDERVAVVIGSNHPGDQEILKWAAFCDIEAEREGRGDHLTYGNEADQFYRNMVHDDTLQAAMRVNRDGEGGLVFVHTNTLPDWIPATRVPGIIETWSNGMREVIDVTRDMKSWTTTEVAQQTDIGRRAVLQNLDILHEMGKLRKVKASRKTFWTRKEPLNEFGAVDWDEINYSWNTEL